MLQPLTPGQPHNEHKQQKQCTVPSFSAHMPIHLASVRHTVGTSSAPDNPLFLTFPTSQKWPGRDCCPHFAELANGGGENIRGFPKVRAEGKSQMGEQDSLIPVFFRQQQLCLVAVESKFLPETPAEEPMVDWSAAGPGKGPGVSWKSDQL